MKHFKDTGYDIDTEVRKPEYGYDDAEVLKDDCYTPESASVADDDCYTPGLRDEADDDCYTSGFRDVTDDDYYTSESANDYYKEPVNFKKVWNIVAGVLSILMALFLLVVFVPKITGIQSYAFLPDSVNSAIDGIYSWIVSAPGLYIVIAVVVLLLLSVFIPEILLSIKANKKNLQEKSENEVVVTNLTDLLLEDEYDNGYDGLNGNEGEDRREFTETQERFTREDSARYRVAKVDMAAAVVEVLDDDVIQNDLMAAHATTTAASRNEETIGDRAASEDVETTGDRAASEDVEAAGDGAASEDVETTGDRAASEDVETTGDGAASRNEETIGDRTASENVEATDEDAAEPVKARNTGKKRRHIEGVEVFDINLDEENI